MSCSHILKNDSAPLISLDQNTLQCSEITRYQRWLNLALCRELLKQINKMP